MLRSKLAKLFMSILKRKVDSSSNFESVFIVMAHNPFVNFKPFFFYFGQKEPIKVPLLTLLSALVNICQISHVSLQTISPLQILHHSSMSWKITPLFFFQLKQDILCSKRRPLKLIFFWLLSAPVKIHQILYVNPEMASQFRVKFCIILCCHKTQLPCKL